MPVPLYGLTLTQPWATLMALGLKCIETRSWGPAPDRLGHLLGIHASKNFPEEVKLLCTRAPLNQVLAGAGYGWTDRGDMGLPRGVIVAIGRLHARYQMQARDHRRRPDWYPNDPHSLERQLGGYEIGRWLWHITEIEALERPVAFRGYPLIYEITGEARHDALSQTKWWEEA